MAAFAFSKLHKVRKAALMAAFVFQGFSRKSSSGLMSPPGAGTA